MSLIELVNEKLSVAIAPNGQLVSIKLEGHEYMHGAGKPDELKDPQDRLGWGMSELVMFPIIGKPKNNLVSMNGNNYSMDQHGISRSIPFVIDELLGYADGNYTQAIISQIHGGGSVPNIKHVDNSSTPETIEWPAYSIFKSIKVMPESIQILFTVNNLTKDSMKYRLGWHPAFRLQGTNDDAVFSYTKDYDSEKIYFSMADIVEASKSGSYQLPGVVFVTYADKKTKRGITLGLHKFSDVALWTKSADSGMFCIEPLTQLPDKNREYLDGVAHESLPGFAGINYFVNIFPFNGKIL